MRLKIVLSITDLEALVLIEYFNNAHTYRLLTDHEEINISKEEFLEKLISTEESLIIASEQMKNRLADMRLLRLKVLENK